MLSYCISKSAAVYMPHINLYSHDRTDGIPEITIHRQTSDGRTKSKDLNVSRLVLQLSLPNPLKLGVKSRMKMCLEQRRQALLQLYPNDQFLYLLRCDLC